MKHDRVSFLFPFSFLLVSVVVVSFLFFSFSSHRLRQLYIPFFLSFVTYLFYFFLILRSTDVHYQNGFSI